MNAPRLQQRLLLLSALCCPIAEAGRDTHKGAGATSLSLTRDGHFQLAADLAASEPVAELKPAEPRRIHALTPMETQAQTTVVNATAPQSQVNAVREGAWVQKAQPLGHTSASSFVNRTTNWMQLSQMLAGSLAARAPAPSTPTGPTPKPTVPPDRYKAKPKSWPMRAWGSYQRAYEKLKPLRGGAGNVAATAAAAFLGPDSCILKILYVFYTADGEDDYPYIPRGCGDMFDFALDANSMPVPWMLIVGALFIITGTHSTANSL